MRKNAILVTFLAACPALYGGVIVNTSLSMSSLAVSTSDSSDTLDFSGLSPAIFGDVTDSFNDYAFASDGSPDDPAMGMASNPYAYVNDTASVAGGLGLSAASGVHIFGITNQAGTDTGNNANISGEFDIDDTDQSSTVNVTFTAFLNASQSLLTATFGNSVGESAYSEVDFQLNLYDLSGNLTFNSPLLYFDNVISIGPDSSSMASGPQSPTASVTLNTGDTYYMTIEADAESIGDNSVAPEPASLILMAAGLAGLGAFRFRRN